MITIKIKNIDQLLRKYDRVGQIVRKEMKGALDKSASVVERSAKHKVPVDTGHLRKSIQKPREIKRGDRQVAVGSNLKYALRQHEGMHFRHRVGEAKFLDKALKENEKKINRFSKQMTDNIIKSLKVLR